MPQHNGKTEMETRYANKSVDELKYIQRDAYEAAIAMQSIGDTKNECRYLDQMNDASTELYQRDNRRAK